MSKILVIVESPAKTKTLRKFLGEGFDVDSSVGHIRDLPKKEMGFDLETLKPNYEISKDKKQVVARLRKKAKAASKVLLATDLDREGEAIAWHLKQVLGLNKKPYGRIVFQEITRSAIQHALNNESDLNMAYVAAQETRRLLDRFVGYSVSPWLTNALPGNGNLSAGRVQTVALLIVCNRHDEIANFIPEPYFVIKAQLNSEGDEWTAELDPDSINIDGVESKENTNVPKGHLTNTYHAERISDFLLEKGSLKIVDIEETESIVKAPPPFTTSTIQQAASNALGFNPKLTMTVAQRLYEMGKITYMRTDTTNLSDEAIQNIRSWLSSYQKSKQVPEPLFPQKPNKFQSKSGAQEAHEAIRPSDIFDLGKDIEGRTEQDTERMQQLYRLIWKRAVASQMSPAVYDKTTVTLNSAIDPENNSRPYTLKATGRVLKRKGWRMLQGSDQTAEKSGDGRNQLLPVLKPNTSAKVMSVDADSRQTKPKPYYNEASLVDALEKEGIGRPSTYAATIETLQNKKYVISTKAKSNKKVLMPTELGLLVIDTVRGKFQFSEIPYTRNIEEQLDAITHRKATLPDVLSAQIKQLSSEIDALGGVPKRNMKQKPQVVKELCPECGEGQVVARNGRTGPFGGCTNYPKCKYTEELE